MQIVVVVRLGRRHRVLVAAEELPRHRRRVVRPVRASSGPSRPPCATTPRPRPAVGASRSSSRSLRVRSSERPRPSSSRPSARTRASLLRPSSPRPSPRCRPSSRRAASPPPPSSRPPPRRSSSRLRPSRPPPSRPRSSRPPRRPSPLLRPCGSRARDPPPPCPRRSSPRRRPSSRPPPSRRPPSSRPRPPPASRPRPPRPSSRRAPSSLPRRAASPRPPRRAPPRAAAAWLDRLLRLFRRATRLFLGRAARLLGLAHHLFRRALRLAGPADLLFRRALRLVEPTAAAPLRPCAPRLRREPSLARASAVASSARFASPSPLREPRLFDGGGCRRASASSSRAAVSSAVDSATISSSSRSSSGGSESPAGAGFRLGEDGRALSVRGRRLRRLFLVPTPRSLFDMTRLLLETVLRLTRDPSTDKAHSRTAPTRRAGSNIPRARPGSRTLSAGSCADPCLGGERAPCPIVLGFRRAASPTLRLHAERTRPHLRVRTRGGPGRHAGWMAAP